MNREPLPPHDVIRARPPDGGSDFNRLIHATSPYLLQHARNPVDWHPWGAEALARAKAEDKPIFLSIGYSACHWCHVMEHESFENTEIAALLNEHFVPVKVDREERPDLDDLYMIVTQLMTSRGGWPNSVWLLPDGTPWYAGTYFPPDDRMGRPGFKTLLLRLADIWRTRRPDVEAQAAQLADAIRAHAAGAGETAKLATLDHLIERAATTWRETVDLQHGGFGSAPKFPPHSTLDLLLHLAEAHRDPSLEALATGTLDALARGGIRDHIGGGFHRYSTDARWLVPHFEKMLYDNAQLALAFAEAAHLQTENGRRKTEYEGAARETLDWILREMTGPEGGFFSALDADSEGEEGRFYIWSHAEVLEALGPDDGALFCRIYQMDPRGNFHDEATGRATGLNIPHLDAAVPTDEAERLARCRQTLLARRVQRVWPGLDDKRLTGWNGLTIKAFARAAQVFASETYLRAAQRASRFLLKDMIVDGELMRVWRAGRAHVPAFLEDYGGLLAGLLALHESDPSGGWRAEAERLGRIVIERFQDTDSGRFNPTSSRHETLLARLPDYFDQAMPSSSALAIDALAQLAALTGDPTFHAAATRALEATLPLATRYPSGCAALLRAGLRLRAVAAAAAITSDTPEIDIALHTHARQVHPGTPVDVDVAIQLPPGWRLQPNNAGERYAVAVEGDFSLVGRDGDRLTLQPSPSLAGEWAVARLLFTVQLCDDQQCRPPETLLRELTLRVAG
ncbi:MAG TPA: thioredoxin domain-containing protein [Kiritimatiellia bacterium]|nr:thioredoxin domain-containing protein [Kiritimatiellia bacterium]